MRSELGQRIDRELSVIEPAPDALDQVHHRVRARARARRLGAVVGALVVTLSLVFGVSLAFRAGPAHRPDSIGLRLIGTLRVPGTPTAVLVRPSDLWVSTCGRGCSSRSGIASGGRILQVDPGTGTIRSSVRLLRSAGAPVASFGSIWVASTNYSRSVLTRIDESSGRVVATIPLRLPWQGPTSVGHLFWPEAIAAGPPGVFVATALGAIARIDPATDRVVRYFRVPGETTGVVAVTEDAVWVAEDLAGVYRIDLRTGAVEKTIVTRVPHTRLNMTWLGVGGGRVWASGNWAPGGVASNRFALVALDPATGRITFREPGPRGQLVSDGPVIWVVSGRSFTRLDPRTGSLSPTFRVPSGRVVAVAGRTVWALSGSRICQWQIGSS